MNVLSCIIDTAACVHGRRAEGNQRGCGSDVYCWRVRRRGVEHGIKSQRALADGVEERIGSTIVREHRHVAEGAGGIWGSKRGRRSRVSHADRKESSEVSAGSWGREETVNPPSRRNHSRGWRRISKQGLSVEISGDGGRISRTEESTVHHKRHASGLTQRGLLEIVRRSADDGGPNGLNFQAKRGIGRIGCNVNRTVAAVDLHLIEPGGLQLVRMLRRVPSNAISD